MNIVVCCKWVLDPDGFRTAPDGSVDTARARAELSEYDRNAIQVARDLAGDAGRVSILTFGAPGVDKLVREALSRGGQAAWCVQDASAADADGRVTAAVLAAAVRAIGEVDLVICGEGAADTYAHEVGPRLAALLGWPVLAEIDALTATDQGVEGRRSTGRGPQTLTAALPVVATVTPDAAPAPIPALKAVLAAKKSPVTVWSPTDLGLDAAALTPRVRTGRVETNTVRRKGQVLTDGSVQDRARALVARLEAEGVLP